MVANPIRHCPCAVCKTLAAVREQKSQRIEAPERSWLEGFYPVTIAAPPEPETVKVFPIYYGIDWAKPPGGVVEWSVVNDPADFGTIVAAEFGDELEVKQPIPEPNPDHIWDMLVLAARASRYEQE